MGALGMALAQQGSAADNQVPLPTVPLPPTTITGPTLPLPTLTADTTPTAPATTPAPASPAPSADGSTPDRPSPAATTAPNGGSGEPPPAGAVELAAGVSVPAASVIAPNKLVVVRATFSPSRIASRQQAVTVVLRLRDKRGYLVRGAIVTISSVLRRRITATAPRATDHEGLVSFRFRPTAKLAANASRLLVLARAVTGVRGNASAATSMRVSIPVERKTR